MRVLNFNGDTLQGVGVTLVRQDLWKEFAVHTTEMIITKSGRKMFPHPEIGLTGLDPAALYNIYLEFAPAENARFKHSKKTGSWQPAGSGELQNPQRIYTHPESPNRGEHWMSKDISFKPIKITNLANAPLGQVVLSSMHKYEIYIHIEKVETNPWMPIRKLTVTFDETKFIAVTAYQNNNVTGLKIDTNPFAKGFRKNGKAKSKRKRQQSETTKEEECTSPPSSERSIGIGTESNEMPSPNPQPHVESSPIEQRPRLEPVYADYQSANPQPHVGSYPIENQPMQAYQDYLPRNPLPHIQNRPIPEPDCRVCYQNEFPQYPVCYYYIPPDSHPAIPYQPYWHNDKVYGPILVIPLHLPPRVPISDNRINNQIINAALNLVARPQENIRPPGPPIPIFENRINNQITNADFNWFARLQENITPPGPPFPILDHRINNQITNAAPNLVARPRGNITPPGPPMPIPENRINNQMRNADPNLVAKCQEITPPRQYTDYSINNLMKPDSKPKKAAQMCTQVIEL